MKKITLALMVCAVSLFAAEVKVYKSPTCGCCSKWGDHMQAKGFKVAYENVQNLHGVKQKMGVPGQLSSCHSAVVEGYIVEGHVPADAVKKLLDQKPKNAKGIAVAGMPLGSPGMEYGGKKESFDVIIFYKDGTQEVFATY
ncbi:MAG: DUF411 domain-containing protein [Campylobacterota bacterium]